MNKKIKNKSGVYTIIHTIIVFAGFTILFFDITTVQFLSLKVRSKYNNTHPGKNVNIILKSV